MKIERLSIMMKVSRIISEFSIIKFFIFVVTCILLSSNINAKIEVFDFEQIKNDIFSKNSGSIQQRKSDTSSKNWTEYQNCLSELNSIKNGLNSYEGWAVKMYDAWGRMPTGMMSGNLVDFGDFSQCFQVNRNEQTYVTQYCLGQLTFNTKEFNEVIDKNLFIKMPSNFPNIEVSEPGFSFGMCLPATCSADHIEFLFNEVTKFNVHGVSLKILKDTCQKEETASRFNTLDLYVLYFLLFVFYWLYQALVTISFALCSILFLVFSFYTNGKKLFSCQKFESSDTVDCLHGIRAMTAQWILFGHSYLRFVMYPRNTATAIKLVSDYSSVIVTSGPIAVETFFVLSGFLVSISILKHLERHGKINILMLYFHRYLRLTPLLTVVFLVSMTLMRFLGNGPVWLIWNEFLTKPCETYWWTTLLYVQNYANPKDFCLFHTWYLSVDMQLFIIAPFIIYLIYRFKSKTIYVLMTLIVACALGTVFVHVKYGLRTLREEGKLENAYYPTHIRFSAWLIGVVGGYIFFECRNRSIYVPKTLNLFGWAISLFLMLAALLANYPLQLFDTKAQPIDFGLYDALSRVGWSFALCYIIFACGRGSGGFINWFLSHPYWQPISRLCYSTYLLHFPVIFTLSASIKSSPHFNQFACIEGYIGIFLVTTILSIIVTLAFESPILVIEKLILKSTTVSKPQTKADSKRHQRADSKMKIT